MRRSGKLLKEVLELGDLFSAAEKNPSLKFQRSCIVKNAYPYKKKRGKFVCRLCGKKPPGKRKYWCSDACAAVVMIRCTPSEAMRWVKVRDKGVCALCGLDTKKLKNLDKQTLEKMGFKYGKAFFEADHIIACVQGGGHCNLDNYRSLCRPCHLVETQRLMVEVRASRKDKP